MSHITPIVKGMIKCPHCGQHYSLDTHNWCPNCRMTFDAATAVNNSINTSKNRIVVGGRSNGTFDDTWEVKIDTINNCDKSPKEIKVKIDPLVKGKIDYLMEKFKGTEWLAYLIGSEEENQVVDIFIPNQVVNSVNVKDVHCKEFNKLNVIGVIHSHHDMGNSFSHTDDEWINQNHNISLCISKSGIKGHVRWKTPCGSYKIVEARVILNIDSTFDTKEFDEIIKDKIKKETFYPQGRTVYSYDKYYNPSNFTTRSVNNTNPNKDPNNPGSYHFTDNPVIHKNIQNEEEVEITTTDHLDEDDITKIGEQVFDEVLFGLECDMKE